MKSSHKSTFMVCISHRFKLLMVNILIFFLGNFTWIVFRSIFFCYEKQGMNFRLSSWRNSSNQHFWSKYFLVIRVLFEEGPQIKHVNSNCHSGVPTSFQILLDQWLSSVSRQMRFSVLFFSWNPKIYQIMDLYLVIYLPSKILDICNC